MTDTPMGHLRSVAVFGMLVLAACNGGHLTRSRAKAQLDELSKKVLAQNENGPHPLLFQIGTVSGACNEGFSKDYDPVEAGAEYSVLAATGYVTVQPIKKHVWRVELSESGKKGIAGEPYAHKQNGNDCDQWQVSIPLSRLDHLDVTGVLEEGVHAKVDVSFTFAITQVGMDARKVAEKYVLEADTKKFGEKLAHDFLPNSLTSLLGGDVALSPPSEKTYIKRGSVMFDKYDDGWKLDEQSAKEER
jgi:hypothetical protein